MLRVGDHLNSRQNISEQINLYDKSVWDIIHSIHGYKLWNAETLDRE